MIHVELRRFLGRFGNRFLRLTLGADEQHAAALGNDVTDRLQSRVQHRDGLRQIDDVNTVTFTIDELAHAGVPTLGLVTVVNASFQKLTQRKFGKRHIQFLSGLRLGKGFEAYAPTGGPFADVSRKGPPLPVKCGGK